MRDHFYHLQENRACHLSQKSETHLYLQLHLQKLLPPGEALLEERFPTINRIADVSWRRYKILFEVQYSPISIEELEHRIEDYRSIGWTLIWILHTHSFFKGRPSREELFLESYTHYFSNHIPRGAGTFFDVFWRGKQIPLIKEGVELNAPLRVPRQDSTWGEREKRDLYFKNDLIDDALRGQFSFPTVEKNRGYSIKRYAKSAFNLFLESVFNQ